MDGIINVYKEKGYTSFDVVAKLRGILKQKRIGHTGTLDPDAEGVLPVCVGAATRACELLTEKDKEYEAVLLFGLKTDTQDISGKVLEKKEVTIPGEEAEAILMSFLGTYEQIPPMYSALKVNGKKLYELAREGKVIERRARPVTIHSIKILETSFEGEEKWIRFRVSCSKGTYIRTLCEDAGEKAGCGGCMKSLVRTRVSSFFMEDSLTLSQIEEKRGEGKLAEILMPVDRFFLKFPAFQTLPEADGKLHNGNKLEAVWLTEKEGTKNDGFQAAKAAERTEEEGQEAAWCRLYDSKGSFYALYHYSAAEQVYRNVKMFIPS